MARARAVRADSAADRVVPAAAPRAPVAHRAPAARLAVAATAAAPAARPAAASAVDRAEARAAVRADPVDVEAPAWVAAVPTSAGHVGAVATSRS
ncbi:MAG: hypothetical protein ACLQPH_19205 [Acidimicrobiales bacterium]